MTVWALGKHRNYRKEFEKYPRGRKSIIPFLVWKKQKNITTKNRKFFTIVWLKRDQIFIIRIKIEVEISCLTIKFAFNKNNNNKE